MPTAPATFSVPARRWRSWLPPWTWARSCVPRRTQSAPTPLGPSNLWAEIVTRSAPTLDLDVGELGADLVTISAHKFEGPKGVGALWVRRGTQLLAQVHGGSQERHRRAGTENVAGAVGMAVAYECACADRPTTAIRLAALRSRLAAACLAVEGVELTGHPTLRLPGLLSLLVRGADGVAISVALDLDGIAASTGSACATGSPEPSHVLTAMGYTEAERTERLRLSLGRASVVARPSDR